VDPTVGPLMADFARFQQVIWNLLSNAVKFTPHGGSVRVEVGGNGSQAVIRIRDTGRGIAPHFLPHVFERFRQADPSTSRAEGGLGLGLAIVRHIVELHGGAVHADSACVGCGATFTIRLPLPAARSITGRPASRSSPPPAPRGLERLDHLRVLIVDDENDAREAVSAVLEERGAAVVSAVSMAGALEAMNAASFDVMISDIGMPFEDGYALIRRIRDLDARGTRKMPALALTAYASASQKARIREAGFDALLTKPVEASELVAEVAQLARSTGAADTTRD